MMSRSAKMPPDNIGKAQIRASMSFLCVSDRDPRPRQSRTTKNRLMSISRQVSKAGSIASLPFLLLASAFLLHSKLDLRAQEEALPTFQVFDSSCIDLGRYDRKEKQLTVRF